MSGVGALCLLYGGLLIVYLALRAINRGLQEHDRKDTLITFREIRRHYEQDELPEAAAQYQLLQLHYRAANPHSGTDQMGNHADGYQVFYEFDCMLGESDARISGSAAQLQSPCNWQRVGELQVVDAEISAQDLEIDDLSGGDVLAYIGRTNLFSYGVVFDERLLRKRAKLLDSGHYQRTLAGIETSTETRIETRIEAGVAANFGFNIADSLTDSSDHLAYGNNSDNNRDEIRDIEALITRVLARSLSITPIGVPTAFHDYCESQENVWSRYSWREKFFGTTRGCVTQAELTGC